MDILTIGQVAKSYSISRDTLRLYERYGLIQPPIRATNGYRQYSQQTIKQLKFIIRAKKIGFTLTEIQELLAIDQSADNSCINVKQRCLSKLEHVCLKIKELQALERGLKKIIHNCDNNISLTCPFFMLFTD